MINRDERVRVYNRCKYSIGVQMLNGVQININAGNFQFLSVDDILFIEGSCNDKKFFSAKMLVPVDAQGKEIPLEDLGLADNNESKHLDDDDIAAALKQNVKKLETWLETIDDPAELHAVYKVALTLDLPASKLKILREKMPSKDWLTE